ncbi:MAG: Rieske (2Fe-2S) protein [Anaerolineae bacterium]
MAQFIHVADTVEIAPGQRMLVELDGHQIALFNVGGEYYAISNSCTHRGGPLIEGSLGGEVVTCPWHGGQFNIKTGEVLAQPPTQPVTTYQVKVEGSDIKIALSKE